MEGGVQFKAGAGGVERAVQPIHRIEPSSILFPQSAIVSNVVLLLLPSTAVIVCLL